jgi:hypothetical protein
MDFLWQILLQNGMSISEVDSIKHLYLLMLLLPFVATIVGISRYIIGLRSLSLYVPLFLTFIFFEMGYSGGTNSETDFLRGLFYGLLLFGTIFIISTLLYSILKKLRMHYIPKLSIIMIGVTISLLVLLFIGAYFNRKTLVNINPFTLIVLVATTESFISVMAKKNFRYTFFIALETLFTATISYLLISWGELQNLVMRNPLVILIPILINVYVGRFIGLRLTEYWRFRKVLSHPDLTPNDKPSTNPQK